MINHEFNVTYRGSRYRLQSKEMIKINGILFLQDRQRREEVNVQKSLDAIEKQLRAWSTRRLTLLGRILVIKTYAISQAIYLMQSMSIAAANQRRKMTMIYKYLWNRNFNAAKAPERIKRSIMLTPVKYGGFGLVDIGDIGN